MNFVYLMACILLYITNVMCYLGERHSPIRIYTNTTRVTLGDTIHITWDLVPGTRFPLYGYASARTAITDVGLLAPDASRTEKYLYMIDQVSVLKYNLKWTITDQVPTGRYQIGVGFFYHETSPEILIV